jgi:hypothetical protein
VKDYKRVDDTNVMQWENKDREGQTIEIEKRDGDRLKITDEDGNEVRVPSEVFEDMGKWFKSTQPKKATKRSKSK